MGIVADEAVHCKILVVQKVAGIFPEYCPEKGSVHDAIISDSRFSSAFCVIDFKGKKIVLRRGEFEIVEG